MTLRIIARLDVKPPLVVKPIHFEGLRKIGLPEDLALKYYIQGADEILYIDIVASLYQRDIIPDLILNTAKKVFVPFAAGGGIKSINDFELCLKNGADKVLINTYALQYNPEIITDAAKIFGSQAVVVHIEAKKWKDQWECYSDCGRIRSGKDVLEWAEEVEGYGAGEIFLSSVDMDGRRRGFDVDLIRKVVSLVDIPVIAGSGAGNLDQISKMVHQAQPSAVAIASLLHYDIATIRTIKEHLASRHIEVAN